MLRKKAGEWLAVLTDFDLSIDVNERGEPLGPSHHERTGTMPFMAIELLGGNRVLHVQRHDLEALYWSFVWLTVRYHDGKCLQPTTRTEGTDANGKPRTVTVPAPLDSWMMASTSDLYHYKRSWFWQPTHGNTTNFKRLGRAWHGPLCRLFTAGAQAQTQYETDREAYEDDWQEWNQLKDKGGEEPEPIKPEFDEATQGGIVTWEAFYKCIQG